MLEINKDNNPFGPQYESVFKEFIEKNETLRSLLSRGFAFQYDTNEALADLLFIGINPSYIDEGAIHKKSYAYDRETTHKYFHVFKEIHKEVNAQCLHYNGIYTHFDLLVFKETRQNFINDTLLKTEEGIKFICRQLEIAKVRLITVSPKVVVVCNTKARTFLGKDKSMDGNKNVWMGLHFMFDEEFGSHRVMDVPELKNTHFFFSSMLSGQRALDIGSRERLLWQIKRVFNASPKTLLKIKPQNKIEFNKKHR